MEPAKKIELPTYSYDGKGVGRIKPVVYDFAYLKPMNIKYWEDKGTQFDDRCAIFNPMLNGEYRIIAIPPAELIKKLTDLGIWEVVK